MRYLSIVLLLFAFTACKPIEDELTPVPTVPTIETGTSVITPTQEILATNTPDNISGVPLAPLFGAINPNWDMTHNTVESLVPDPDGIYRRYQCVPSLVMLDISFPNPESPRTPAYINCDLDNADGGVHRVEITQVDGVYQWRHDIIYFPQGYCFLMKVTGSSDFVGNSLDNIGFSFGMDTLDSRRFLLPRQRIPRHEGFELVQAVQINTFDTGIFYAQLEIDWAVFVGSVNISSIEFMRVPEAYCEGSPVW